MLLVSLSSLDLEPDRDLDRLDDDDDDDDNGCGLREVPSPLVVVDVDGLLDELLDDFSLL